MIHPVLGPKSPRRPVGLNPQRRHGSQSGLARLQPGRGDPFWGTLSRPLRKTGRLASAPPFPLFPSNGLPQRPLLGLFSTLFPWASPFWASPKSKKAKRQSQSKKKKQTRLKEKRSTERRQWHRPLYRAKPTQLCGHPLGSLLCRNPPHYDVCTFLHNAASPATDDAYFLSIPFFFLSYVDPLPKTASVAVLIFLLLSSLLYTLYDQTIAINTHTHTHTHISNDNHIEQYTNHINLYNYHLLPFASTLI